MKIAKTKVSFSIKLAVFLARGGACMKLRQNGTVFRVLNWPLWQPAGTANRRISNIEYRMPKEGRSYPLWL
jgi:hypothetical protein